MVDSRPGDRSLAHDALVATVPAKHDRRSSGERTWVRVLLHAVLALVTLIACGGTTGLARASAKPLATSAVLAASLRSGSEETERARPSRDLRDRDRDVSAEAEAEEYDDDDDDDDPLFDAGGHAAPESRVAGSATDARARRASARECSSHFAIRSCCPRGPPV